MQIQRTVLIGGAPSSGSTLLSVMLDAHPEIHCGPEIGILAHSALYKPNFEEAARALSKRLERCEWLKNDALGNLAAGCCPYALIDGSNLGAYGQDLQSVQKMLLDCDSVEALLERLYQPTFARHGKGIWAEKTPSNLYAFEAFLGRFPEGLVVYLVRDPRAVVASLLKRGMGLRRALSIWLVEVAICERLFGHPRVLRVRYEDLIQDTAGILTEIATFLRVDSAIGNMLRYGEESNRVKHDRTLVSLSSWNANPTQPVSMRALDAWKGELDWATLAVLQQAQIVCAPDGMEWAKGVRLADLAARLGYAWEAIRASVADVWERLIGERLIGATQQAFDSQIFHERFVESRPPAMSEAEEELWASVVRGAITSYRREQPMFHELRKTRETCCHWYEEFNKANHALAEMSIAKDKLERQQVETETNLKKTLRLTRRIIRRP